MFSDCPKTLAACAVIISTTIVLLIQSPSIHKWEREAGYPFGHLCDLYRNCK